MKKIILLMSILLIIACEKSEDKHFEPSFNKVGDKVYIYYLDYTEIYTLESVNIDYNLK